jgi:hypothetical protein
MTAKNAGFFAGIALQRAWIVFDANTTDAEIYAM